MLTRVPLRLTSRNEALLSCLSAITFVGDELWAGGDEGVQLLRLQPKDGGYEEAEVISLLDLLDLPAAKADEDGEFPEVDLEGMDWDDQYGRLWFVGSHSFKRKAAKARKEHADNIKRISKVVVDGNRFLLGCLPFEKSADGWRRLEPREYTPKHFAARLACSLTSGELLDALRDDPLFHPFVAPGHPVPGKDNGLDIEGLAYAGDNRLLLGLRGPVLRGIAMLIEIEVETHMEKGVGFLRLARIGPGERAFRRHFLDLDGLGIRDLCFEPDGSLLILAGPTMPMDWPPVIYRWNSAREHLFAKADTEERFVWQKDNELESIPTAAIGYQEAGTDRAEGLGLARSGHLLLAYDSPSAARLKPKGSVLADLVELPVGRTEAASAILWRAALQSACPFEFAPASQAALAKWIDSLAAGIPAKDGARTQALAKASEVVQYSVLEMKLATRGAKADVITEEVLKAAQLRVSASLDASKP